MSKVKFNLKDRKQDPALIILIFRYGRIFKYSTGIHISLKYWNDNKQRVKSTRAFPQHKDINILLDTLAVKIESYHKQLLAEDTTPSNELFKIELDVFLKKTGEIKKKKETLFDFIDKLIKERGTTYAPGSIVVYRTIKRHLKDYETREKITPDFHNMDMAFFRRFTDYFFKKNYSNNAINKIVSTLKTFLTEAEERGIKVHPDFKKKKFAVKKEAVQNIYLSLGELQKLYEHKFEKRLDRVRDLFIIGAFTGLRFSDFTQIGKENIKEIDGVKLIKITTQKTGQSVVIPLHKYVQEIWTKYGEQLPKTLSNQKMNAYLKEIAKIVGFNEDIVLTRTRGGKREDVVKKKWELVTTHTARRSFATNAFKSGIPALSIMKLTGHKSESSFMKYIKISNEENALLMAKSAFFR